MAHTSHAAQLNIILNSVRCVFLRVFFNFPSFISLGFDILSFGRFGEFAKDMADSGSSGLNGDTHQSNDNTSQNGQTEIKETESRGQNPDVNDGDQSENQSPHK